MSAKIDIRFKLNGVERQVAVTPAMSALEMLRDIIGLTGTKYACGEGECGACTIRVDGITVNACLMFAIECDSRELMTIEGLVTTPLGEALRKSFTENGAVQCGFCTPGIMMQATHMLERDPHPARTDIQRGIEGNLCRCTGYKKIVDAIAAVDIEPA
jgi:aerobic carbon-monoxide dehydrogenase small subunit